MTYLSNINEDTGLNFDPAVLTVLVVDDSAPMRNIIGSILKSYGIRKIEMASDGLDALGQVRKRKFDFIICDLMMQGMDGFEFLRNLRVGLPSPSRETPTIILSSNADLNSILQARDAGMNEYLVKPISSATLWQRVVSLMNTPRAFVESEVYTGPAPRSPRSDNRVGVSRPMGATAVDPFEGPASDSAVFTPELMDRYVVILRKEVEAIITLVEEMTAKHEPARSDWIELVRKCHDLKGHSGSFGYILISNIAHTLCEFSRNILDNMKIFRARRQAMMDLLTSLADTLKSYMAHDVRDGAREHANVQSLRHAIENLGVSL